MILFVSTSSAIAQDLGGDAPGGATSMIENAIKVSESSEQGLNNLWEITFTGNYSPGYLAVMDFAKKIMVIPFFWLLIPITQAFTFNRYEEIFKHVAWLVLICVLTVNNYGLITKIAYGSRNFVNDTTKEILSYQLGQVTMQDALTDVLLTEGAKDEIRVNFTDCEAKEGEEQLKCFQDGAKEANNALAKVDETTNFQGIKRLRERLRKIVSVIDSDEDPSTAMANSLVSFFFQSAGQAIAQQLMKGFQSAMMTIIDVGFYLTAMLSPIAVAASLAPLQPRVIFIWASGFIAFALMKMSYNILIGAIATVALTVDATDFGSTGLLIAMGVISPLLAMAMGGWGGARLVHEMAGGASAAVAMVPVPMPRPR
ncbi:MAG: hypothetical protein DCF25_20660 [Leptolyngbya foveolarum]|uniref:Uncharacterized protein n=1 Tax=Leptolyngbya foveolarum TaxID=47253 RepID=A0A2W4VDY1_9CYAN|nr:MAG: hypothetical protein DCF25_20660 [Leptolyngbya foveolarum]